MGFFKTGLSLMVLFMFSVIVLSVLRFDEFAVSLGVTIWFYGFFHANHLASLSDEEFAEVKDSYLFAGEDFGGQIAWASKYHKVLAGLLIVIGVILLWNTATDMARNFLPEYIWKIMYTVGDYVPRVVVAILIMIVGVKMILGRKAQLAQNIVESKQKEDTAAIQEEA